MILEQARKQNVGIIAAHQYLTQLSQKTLDSLYANTSIKFAGGVSDKDAYALARNMRCEPSFIAEQAKGSFAAFVRNTTKSAISVQFPLLPGLKEMSDKEYADVLAVNRAKYAVHYSQAAKLPPEAGNVPPPAARPDTDSAQPKVRPSDQKTEDDPKVQPPQRSKWPMDTQS